MTPHARTRWAIALGVAGVLALLAIVGLSNRASPAHAPASPPPAPPAAPPPPPPPPPTAKAALKRADLLAAAAAAAASYAAGEPYSAENQALVGRRFEVEIAFGCEGPAPPQSSEPAAWSLDLKSESLVIAARPLVWTDTPWVRALLDTDTDIAAAEGFWIPRPWTSEPGCPAKRTPLPGADPPARTEPSVGLIQTFSSEDSRLHQRGDRPYKVVRKASEAELTTNPRELRLVLTGRISGFATGDAVRCYGASIDQRPTCLFGVEIERVAFVDPATHETLGAW